MDTGIQRPGRDDVESHPESGPGPRDDQPPAPQRLSDQHGAHTSPENRILTGKEWPGGADQPRPSPAGPLAAGILVRLQRAGGTPLIRLRPVGH